MERQKEYYATHREQVLSQQKTRYEENKEKILIYQRSKGKLWYAKNKDRLREHRCENTRKWYRRNKEYVADYGRKYRAANPDAVRRHAQKRRALKSNLPHSFTDKQWAKTKESFGNCCAYCGKELQLEQEHFIPLTKGGEYTSDNIIPACRACNSSKKNKDFFKWYPVYEHYCPDREQKILNYLNYQNNTQQLSIL